LGQRDTGKEEVPERKEESDIPVLGLDVRTLDKDLKERLNAYQDEEGVLVIGVEPYSAAWDARITQGDLIVQIEDQKIRTVSDYRKALKTHEKGEVIIFYMKRDRTDFHAFVKVPE
jgi:serine protease Do